MSGVLPGICKAARSSRPSRLISTRAPAIANISIRAALQLSLRNPVMTHQRTLSTPGMTFVKPCIYGLNRRTTCNEKSILRLASPIISRRSFTTLKSSVLDSTASATSFNSTSVGDDTAPIVGYWLAFTSLLVFTIVLVGGLTRLTESGLSMTEWNVFKTAAPQTPEEWQTEFEKYQNFPEYRLNPITLSEFKFIFYMEWFHRNLGRFIGLCVIVPGLFLYSRSKMSPRIARHSFVIACLVGCQGVLGWLMVRSGLDQSLQIARVNHYYLSAHLFTAFMIFSYMLYTSLTILSKRAPQYAVGKMAPRLAHATTALVLTTAVSGAWVAGLDAGLIYNEFPYMGLTLIPSDYWSTLFAPYNSLKASILNITGNPAAVQFNHRLLGVSTFSAVTVVWAVVRSTVPRGASARTAAGCMLGVACVQVMLGISTLLMFVPVPLAAAHQGGSLSLLGCGIWLMHTLKRRI